MKKEDKESQKRYLEKVARARTTLNLINPDETTLEKMERIRRAKEDVRYMVMTYLPHYATAECAEFQIRHAGKVKEDPLYKGYAEWACQIRMERRYHPLVAVDEQGNVLLLSGIGHIRPGV